MVLVLVLVLVLVGRWKHLQLVADLGQVLVRPPAEAVLDPVRHRRRLLVEAVAKVAEAVGDRLRPIAQHVDAVQHRLRPAAGYSRGTVQVCNNKDRSWPDAERSEE